MWKAKWERAQPFRYFYILLKIYFIPKPFNKQEIIAIVNRAFEKAALLEENFILPKILRTYANAHNPELYPEVYKGSVNMYPTTMLHSSDAEFTEMISSLVSKAEKINSDLPSKAKLSHLLLALKDYRDKIHAHAIVEGEVLIPRAKKLEDEIKKRLHG